MPQADLLGAIVAAARRIVADRREREPVESLERRAMLRTPAGAAFREALAAEPDVNVIAECKRRSPAKGVLARDYDPATTAGRYQQGGAAAVSVLTEPTFFDGALAHLEAVRAATTIPLLRKDFIVDEYQLLEARAAGADAVLLIVAALAEPELAQLLGKAKALGLGVLVETHSSDEVRAAIDAGATVVGVNSRNLRTLEVDLRACDRLIGEIPSGTVAIAESGIKSVDDVRHLHGLGYQGILVGEWLMTAPDPASRVREARAASVRRSRPATGEMS